MQNTNINTNNPSKVGGMLKNGGRMLMNLMIARVAIPMVRAGASKLKDGFAKVADKFPGKSAGITAAVTAAGAGLGLSGIFKDKMSPVMDALAGSPSAGEVADSPTTNVLDQPGTPEPVVQGVDGNGIPDIDKMDMFREYSDKTGQSETVSSDSEVINQDLASESDYGVEL